jgi:hypothetical protein
MRVHKVAEIFDNRVQLCGSSEQSNRVAAYLTNLEVIDKPDLRSRWILKTEIGRAAAKIIIELELAPQLPIDLDEKKPHSLLPSPIAYFRRMLFLPDYEAHAWQKSEESSVAVQKYVILEDLRRSKDREFIASITLDSRTSETRKAIPQDLKLAVWVRDGGACVTCGSKNNLQFDHIIPVSKGGSNTEANLRVLCQPCNLAKSDRIGAP